MKWQVGAFLGWMSSGLWWGVPLLLADTPTSTLTPSPGAGIGTRVAHHAEVQEIAQFFVGAHGCHSLRLVHHPARAAGVGTGVRPPGLETALW